jgi:hypothetical protein
VLDVHGQPAVKPNHSADISSPAVIGIPAHNVAFDKIKHHLELIEAMISPV